MAIVQSAYVLLRVVNRVVYYSSSYLFAEQQGHAFPPEDLGEGHMVFDWSSISVWRARVRQSIFHFADETDISNYSVV